MDMKLELVAVPVTDVDRAKAFYVDQVGFNADHDHRVSEDLRFVQLTPPGSACSIAIGKGLDRRRRPARSQGLQMVVADVEAAHAELSGRGVEVQRRSTTSRGAASSTSPTPTATAGRSSSSSRWADHRRAPPLPKSHLSLAEKPHER